MARCLSLSRQKGDRDEWEGYNLVVLLLHAKQTHHLSPVWTLQRGHP